MPKKSGRLAACRNCLLYSDQVHDLLQQVAPPPPPPWEGQAISEDKGSAELTVGTIVDETAAQQHQHAIKEPEGGWRGRMNCGTDGDSLMGQPLHRCHHLQAHPMPLTPGRLPTSVEMGR